MKDYEDNVERFPIQRITKNSKQDINDIVIKERPLTIILNNQELVTVLCSPGSLEYLAIGFLFSEGLIKNKSEIKRITLDDQRGIIRVETEGTNDITREFLFKRMITSGCGRGASFYSATDIQSQMKVDSQTIIAASEVFALVKELQHRSHVYKTTGGVHSAALCNNQTILMFNEDIGRHNAIDKIFGECILRDVSPNDHIVITSGRISSEILLKVAKQGIPIIISKSAPTDLGIKLSEGLGVTLVGFVRGERMNIYSHRWRISN